MPFRLRASMALFVSCVLVAGCSDTPQVTRAALHQELGQPRVLTQLARQFMAETPYVVNFAFDKWDLDATAKARLDQQADWILAHPQARFSVYGHTDLMGSDSYNLALGLRRAEAVVNHLISRGVQPARLEIRQTLGEGAPILDAVEPALINRRAVTYVDGILPTHQRHQADRTARLVAMPSGGANPGSGSTNAGSGTTTGSTGGSGPSPSGNGVSTPPPPTDNRCQTPTSCDRPEGPNANTDHTGPWTDPGGSGGNDPAPNGNAGGSRCNSGRGNGDEGCDPGRSEPVNKGGDE